MIHPEDVRSRLEKLDQRLYAFDSDFATDMQRINGDILVLGAGGKMGPSLLKLARLGCDAAGVNKRILAVSRFQDQAVRDSLAAHRIEIAPLDLLDDQSLQQLPDFENVIYMAGTKFGTTGNEHYTWAMNAYLPGRIATRFPSSNIVVFSTGNVYPLTPIESEGPSETSATGPVGEYAQSCLGRERVFEYFSHTKGTPILIYRLNYAIDLRYGVLLEIAKAVKSNTPIDLTMGYVNVIWQGDANQIAIRCLNHCSSPPAILNVTGNQKVSIRWLAHEFSKRLGEDPILVNEEEPTALLSNASQMEKLFPFAKVSISEMIDMTTEWLDLDGPMLKKPTHFQARDGRF
jgi:nucleoside-diphosphate-sugar epimerase